MRAQFADNDIFVDHLVQQFRAVVIEIQQRHLRHQRKTDSAAARHFINR
jgi:hypothetical protein